MFRASLKKILFLFTMVALVSVVSIHNVFAEISYPSINQRLIEPPTYCVVSPLGVTATERSELVTLATSGVSKWSYQLQEYEDTSPLFWQMNSKIISSGDSLSECDITLEFKPTVEEIINAEGITTVGIFSTSNQSIEIAYDNLSLDEIFNIIIHEIGHSIGLGHYVSDDNEENKKWYSGTTFSPSIMIPTTNSNPSLMGITEIDILKVREIYGSDGFYAFSPIPPPTTPTPIPTPKPTPEPKPIPTTPLIPVKPFKSIQISENNIVISKYDTRYVKITGQIHEELLLQGHPVYILVKNPEIGFNAHKIQPTKSGYFELPLAIDRNWEKGIYEVEASYLEHTDYDMNFEFSVRFTTDNSLSPQKPQNIPIKESSSGKYLENIQVKSENNEYLVSSRFTTNTESMPSMRIVIENECPAKKEILRKDFVFTPGKEVEFSFYQLSQGKPEKCSLHFSITDFDGNEIEKIVTTYDVESLPKATIVKESKVPDWVKNNAKWWSEGQVDDSTFTQGIGFLIKENVIGITDLPEQVSNIVEEKVPDWVKNNAKWWADGMISEDDFVTGIKYLVEKGIVKVN